MEHQALGAHLLTPQRRRAHLCIVPDKTSLLDSIAIDLKLGFDVATFPNNTGGIEEEPRTSIRAVSEKIAVGQKKRKKYMCPRIDGPFLMSTVVIYLITGKIFDVTHVGCLKRFHQPLKGMKKQEIGKLVRRALSTTLIGKKSQQWAGKLEAISKVHFQRIDIANELDIVLFPFSVIIANNAQLS